MKPLLAIPLVLFVAMSSSLSQTHLVEYEGNPVMWVGPGSSWDNLGVGTGALFFDDTSYRMWYCGWNQFTMGLGYATSSDGIHWMKYAGNPIMSAVKMWPGTCIIDNGVLHFYYILQNPSTAVLQVMHATSTNGLAWTPDNLNNPLALLGSPGSWDDIFVDPRVVLKQDSLWRMWYTGFHTNATDKIGYATSTDGIHWTKPSPFPVLGASPTGWDQYDVDLGDLVIEQSGYQLWYHGTPLSQIGYATSADGLSWSKFAGNPVFTEQSTHVNAAWATLCRVAHQRGIYKMWYDMNPNVTVPPYAWLIGFAVDSDSGYIMAHPAVATFNTTHTDSTGNTIPILLKNYGRHTAQVLSLTLSTPDFELVNPPPLPIDVAAAQWDTLKVRFTPQQGGMRYDTLRIVSTSAADTVFEVYLSGLATGVADARSGVPKAFALEQNYPNPFNPATVISCQLPVAGNVKLMVYDLLGREVAVLVNERQAPGGYEVRFDGSNRASGIYLYRLTVRGEGSNSTTLFDQTRWMILLK